MTLFCDHCGFKYSEETGFSKGQDCFYDDGKLVEDDPFEEPDEVEHDEILEIYDEVEPYEEIENINHYEDGGEA